MEPGGRNRWQPVANGRASKTAQTSRSATGDNPTATVSGAHGKEGVDGSSPSEGSTKAPHIGASRSDLRARRAIAAHVRRSGSDQATSHRFDDGLRPRRDMELHVDRPELALQCRLTTKQRGADLGDRRALGKHAQRQEILIGEA
jgi:hypothetical protein